MSLFSTCSLPKISLFLCGIIWSATAFAANTDSLMTNTVPDFDSAQIVAEMVAPDGHAKCIVTKVINCQDKTVTLSAIYQTLSGTNTAITAPWNTGAVAHQIVVVPPGSWEWSTSALDCDHFLNSITINETFFDGPLDITGPTVLCPGQSGELEVDVNGYNFATANWSPPNPSIGQISPYQIPGPGNFVLSAVDQMGCPFTDNHQVIQSPPMFPFISTPPFLCPEQNTVTISANPTTFAAYDWSNGATTTSITVSEPGDYEVTITNVHGCTVTRTMEVMSGEIADVPIVATSNSICPGGKDTLKVFGFFINYVWSNGTIGLGNIVNEPGLYMVTVTNVHGCTDTSSYEIFPSPGLSPTLSATPLCPGSSTVLTPAGGNYTKFTWSNGSTTSTLNASTPGNYAVTVGNSSGCTGSISVNVPAAPVPNPAITGPPKICPAAMAMLDAGPGYNSYQWSNSANTQSINSSTAGTYTVTVTNAAGCTNTAQHTFTISPAPNATVSGPPNFCSGTNSALQATPGFVQYAWASGQNTPNITVNQSGNYVVTVTDNLGCTNTASAAVAQIPPIVPSIAGPTKICIGSNAQFTVNGNYAQYAWTGGNTTASLSTAIAGTYVVTVTDANGCTGTATKSLEIGTALSPQISSPPYACDGKIKLSAGQGFSTYAWSNGSTVSDISVQTPGNFSVTVTDGTGCSGSAVQNVSIPTPPQTTVSGDNQLCPAETTMLSASPGYAQYAWSNGQSTANISTGQAANYIVTVTDANGCTATANRQVTQFPMPMPSIAGPMEICQGASAQFNVGGNFTQFLWSNGNTTATLSASATGNFSVTVTDVNGCTGTDTHSLNVPAPPQATVVGDNQLCPGENTQLQASAGFAQYAWSNNQTTPNITASQTGNYIVTVTNTLGCTATAARQITVNPAPQPSIAGPTVICIGGSANLSLGSTFSQYLWSNNQTTPSITVSSQGNYVVTVTDANGCTAATSHPLDVGTSLSLQIAQAPYNCNGNISINAGQGFATYLWSNNATTQNLTVQNSGSYVVTVSDGTGCSGTASINVNIPTPPQAAVSGVNTLCPLEFGPLSATAGYAQYAWSSGQNTAMVSVMPGNYTVTVTDIYGCTTTASKSIGLSPALQPNILGPNSICVGGSAMINIGASYAQYAWSTGATTPSISITDAGNYIVTVTNSIGCSGTATHPLAVTNGLSTQIQSAPYACNNALTIAAGQGFATYTWSNGATTNTITVQNAGNYIVTITDGSGCTGTAQKTITIPALPVANITGINEICEGSNAMLQANSGFVLYKWTNGQTNPTITVTQTGNYTVTVTDVNGCTATANHALLVHLPSLTQFQQKSCFAQDTGLVTVVLSNQFGCDSTVQTRTVLSPQVSAQATVTSNFNGVSVSCFGSNDGQALITPNGGTAPFSYAWNNNATQAQLQNLTAGTYSATVTDANGCTNFAAVTLTQPVPIVPAFETVPVECYEKGAIRLQSITGGKSPYDVKVYGQTFINDGASPAALGDYEPGQYPILVTDANGCTQTQTVQLTNPAPIIEYFVADTVWAKKGQKIAMEAPSGYTVPFTWDQSAALSCVDCAKTIATIAESETFTVRMKGYGNCKVEKVFPVLLKGIYVPNVINPESAENNIFTIYGTPYLRNIKVMRIYTRWGELVSEFNNITPNGPEGWNGSFRDKRVVPGVYVFYAELEMADGTKSFEKGDVTVFR